MKFLQRIAIIGNAGSGKSVLAQKLHTILKIPIHHLDQYFWKPNWTHPNIEEYGLIHHELCDQDSWIIDGMNLRFLEYRAQHADMIIFLNIPRYRCFWNIFKRTWHYYGTTTPSSAAGCPERINWDFIKFLKWVWNFKKRYPNKIHKILQKYADQKKIYIFTSYSQVEEFLKKLSLRDTLI